jgi:hypothetical protein
MLVWLTDQNEILGLKQVFAFLVVVFVIFVHSQGLYVTVYSTTKQLRIMLDNVQ